MTVPEIIFIVPYRDRENNKHVFLKYMEYIMEDYDPKSYEIYFSHQKDDRLFNRGAMKNLGFIAMKNKYPNDYKNINFVFNDIDNIPYKKGLLDYYTVKGTIKHYFGYKHVLGGIFSIKGIDFENINGFPNYWGWGFEDNEIQRRALDNKLIIDRNNWFKFNDSKIISTLNGRYRKVSSNMHNAHKKGQFKNSGINTLSNISYKINGQYIDVSKFNTTIPYFKQTGQRDVTSLKPRFQPKKFKFL